MQSQFMAAINQLCDEKNIPREKVIETIEAALKAAYRKDYGNKDQNIEVELNDSANFATIFIVKEVVKKVEEPDLQITLAKAKEYKKNPKIGDEIKIDVTPLEYGRIAAQAAKQVIIQRMQEAERDVMYETFKNRENELINALVHRVENRQVYVNLDNKITNLLPTDQQIPGEQYYGGQRIKLYLDKVIKTTKGPQLVISRTHPNLVRKLLELEIPEIKSGVVEIKGIAREPGVRCKVAVYSNDDKIDPIGSCVGQKGVRVQNIMDELNGEKIDVIPWNANKEDYIKIALAPAKITYIKFHQKENRALCYVEPDQRPLAIGKKGQNVRLASRLTETEIDILDIGDLNDKEVPKVQAETDEMQTVESLGLDAGVLEKLEAANLTLVQQIKGLSKKDLQSVDGIDEKAAALIVKAMKKK
ncbi:transcription termination factor NusA [Patescibacteria group bacterium]|nr:transcription termination factor NusA [Patescibacteria group bacterium]